MENFKISVDVNVKFSEETIKAIASIFSSASSAATTQAPATQAHATQAHATQAPATAKPETKPATAAPATAAPAKPASISIDEVRAVLVNKVNAHREEIKNKLTELGAPSVTKLDPSKYEEMLNFLNSLD